MNEPNIRLSLTTATSLLLAVGLLISAAPLSATPAVQAWLQRYNGPGNGPDSAYAIAVAPTNGNVYVTGASMTTNNSFAYATIAYSSHGTALWTNLYIGPAQYDFALAIATDSSNGNVYATGRSYSANGSGFATVAYSSTGTPLWTNHYHNPLWGYAEANVVAVGAAGNVYVAGTLSYIDEETYATLAYSSTGSPLWTNIYSGKTYDHAYITAMAVDGQENVYVTGSASTGSGGSAIVTVAYSGTGTPLWTNRYISAFPPLYHGAGAATAIALDNSNSRLYVTGYSSGDGTGYDYATIAYCTDGTPLWTNRYNATGNSTDDPQAIAVDQSGNVYVTGTTSAGWDTLAYTSSGIPLWTNQCDGAGQAVAIDGSGNVVVAGSVGSGSSRHYATVAYSSSGVLLWSNRYNGPIGEDDSHPGNSCLAIGPDGGVYVTGASEDTHAGVTNCDYATIKYMPAPDIQFTGIDPLPGAAWRLTLTAPTNVLYRLQTSSNLANWLTLTNYTNLPFTSIQYTDTPAPSFSNRFYRAVWVP